MTRLLVANDVPEQLVGAIPAMREALGWWAQRLIWHMQDDDILVLPTEPDASCLKYVAKITGTRHESLRVVVPPAGRAGAHNLSADRLADPGFRAAVRDALGGRRLDAVLPLCPDASVVALARSLGAEGAVPGAAFASQSGGALANSKAVFRAVAAGAGVPVPEGSVVGDPLDAEDTIAEFLGRGVPVIVKKEYAQGCNGNELLSPVAGVKPIGARRGLVLEGRTAIKRYVTESWDWLTNGERHKVVVERYHPGSRAVFAEYVLTDQGVELAGQGELVAAPMPDGQVLPAVGLAPVALAQLVDATRRLCEAVHALGYRGTLGPDAIVTPDGEILFTEYNGRITGSTHIYATVGARVVGKEAMRRRILLERQGWTAPSFQVAVDRLFESGLAYNPATEVGIVLVSAFNPVYKVISYCIVAEDLPAALELEERLDKVSPRARQDQG
ncbi:peptide ligase PGM1-related protein [Sorangium sp. So ce1128]|uniref:ATP-grasp domain-containing protein n=1 Tax=Sorangium cellulosum TaxID=56 RepID=A0A3S7UZS9_SORCE|nr:hypothetical protein [Sorangium cellulosum]